MQPAKSKYEKKYIKSLADELQKKLKNQKILTEYGSGRQRIDIVVDGKVPIELKKDLKGTSELHRVIGQLHQYNKTDLEKLESYANVDFAIVLLYKENVEIPSDYQGVTYLSMDNNKNWQKKLIKEFDTAGINVEKDLIINLF